MTTSRILFILLIFSTVTFIELQSRNDSVILSIKQSDYCLKDSLNFKIFDVTLKNNSDSNVIFFDNSCAQGDKSFLFQITKPDSTYLLQQRLWWRSIPSISEILPNDSVVYHFELESSQFPKTDFNNSILVKYHRISDGSIYSRRDYSNMDYYDSKVKDDSICNLRGYSKMTYSDSMKNSIETKEKKYPHIFEEDLISESIKF
jgi:hypothetical protein